MIESKIKLDFVKLEKALLALEVMAYRGLLGEPPFVSF